MEQNISVMSYGTKDGTGKEGPLNMYII